MSDFNGTAPMPPEDTGVVSATGESWTPSPPAPAGETTDVEFESSHPPQPPDEGPQVTKSAGSSPVGEDGAPPPPDFDQTGAASAELGDGDGPPPPDG